MANKHSTLTGLFTDIADAIRVKTGGSEPININDFPNEIEQISTTTSADLIEYDENQTVKDKIDSIVVDIDTKINETKDNERKYIISKDLDLCEGCGELKPVIIVERKAYYIYKFRYFILPIRIIYNIIYFIWRLILLPYLIFEYNKSKNKLK